MTAAKGVLNGSMCGCVFLLVTAVVIRPAGTVMQQATSLCPSPAPAHPMWTQQTPWAGEVPQAYHSLQIVKEGGSTMHGLCLFG